MGFQVPQKLLLFDGECGLCDRFVQWVLEQDGEGVFHFTPLQGETAARLREELELPSGLETAVLVETGVVYVRSRAVFRVLRDLPAPWRWFAGLRFFPAFMTDPAYRFVASIRHRFRGGAQSCRLPAVGEQERILP